MKILVFAGILVLTGCATSHLKSRVESNPIPAIEAAAAEKYRIYHIDENNTELVNAWFWHSLITLGYSSYHARLSFNDGVLKSKFYLRSAQAPTWMFPYYVDLRDSIWGAGIKPIMQDDAREILRWGGIQMDRNAMTHGHDPAMPFD